MVHSVASTSSTSSTSPLPAPQDIPLPDSRASSRSPRSGSLDIRTAPRDASPRPRNASPSSLGPVTVHPAVQAMVDKLDTAVTQAQSHPQRAKVVESLVNTWKSVDAVRALTAADDHRIRHHPEVQVALAGAREVLAHMKAVVQHYRHRMPPTVAQELDAQFQQAEGQLRDFSTDSSVAWRASVLTAVRAFNTFVFLGVPLAENQKKTTALYVGSASKSALRALGLGMRPTTHGRQVFDHFIGRDFINTQQSLLFAVGLISRLMEDGPAKQRLHDATHATPYLVSVGVASVIAAAVAFHHRELSGALDRMFYGSAQPHLKGEETFGDVVLRQLKDYGRSLLSPEAWQRRKDDLSQLDPEVRQALEHVFDLSGLASEGMVHLKGEMGKLGDLSDSSSKTLGKAEGAFDGLHKGMAIVLGEPAPEQHANAQFVGKAFLAALALGACMAPVYFLKDNPIGFVDLLANAAFVTLIMGMHAGNRHTTLQTSEDDFGQFCGFSMTMAPVWGYNLGVGDPMEQSWADAMKGAAVLSVLGNTVAAPLGKVAGLGAGKVAGFIGGAPTEGEAPQIELGERGRAGVRPLPDDYPMDEPPSRAG